MIGVSKLAAQAMAGNNNQISRANIEAAINNDIQLIQQKDSQLTYQWIEENDNPTAACANPGRYLASMMEEPNVRSMRSVVSTNKNILSEVKML